MNYKVISITLTAVLFFAIAANGQKIKSSELDELALQYAKGSFDELYDFFSIPNDATYPEDIEKNVSWCENAFSKRGFETQRLETSTVPLLLASRIISPKAKTVLIYLQVDGQPVDSSAWFQESPWTPTLKAQNADGKWEILDWSKLEGELDRDWRIFVRSASDARGPDMMFLKAMDIINDRKLKPNFNMKVILDFEEELGSPRLPKAVVDYSETLSADMLIIFDGPRHISNEPTLTYGARGIATVSLEVFGPRVPQHSGHYGNYAPNPALRLSQLLSSMKDNVGRVTIPNWYDGITLSPEVKAILKQVPDNEDDIKRKIGISEIDAVATNYQESIQYPSLNIRGMRSAWVGAEARTIVPASATAEIDIRLVKESDAQRMVDLVKNHVREQGYYLIDGEPTDEERMQYGKIARFNYEISYDAFRTDYDTEVGSWLRSGMRKAFGADPIQIRTGGGSIPISPFVVTLDVPAVIIPTVNPDNNQHSPNENIRIGNYIDGIKTITAILTTDL